VATVEGGTVELELVGSSGSVSSLLPPSSPVHTISAITPSTSAATPAMSAASGPGWRHHGSGSGSNP
jgi:hypothetical protein